MLGQILELPIQLYVIAPAAEDAGPHFLQPMCAAPSPPSRTPTTIRRSAFILKFKIYTTELQIRLTFIVN
jgi:hypothetical protein